MGNPIPEGKSRLGWFDAMRGLAIILVVLGHVLLFSFGLDGDKSGVLSSIISAFHMPLFFFISGFFAYKACENWTTKIVRETVKRRFQALIICPLVFFVLLLFFCNGVYFCHIHDGTIIDWLRGGYFCGYWFTIVLFQMFVVFLVLSLLSKLFKSERILEVGLILVSLVGLVVLATKLLDDSLLWGVLCTKNFCHYFQFFALGIFCRKYRELFESLLSKNWFKAGITICAVICLVLCFNDGIRDNGLLYRFVRFILTSYALTLIVVAFFFSKREFFERQNATSSALRYIGQRTLDIYMIHYFFFPDLRVLTEWIAPNNMFILQLFIGLAVSLAIVALCLLLGEVLRLSSFLSAWLFGVKSREQS